MDRFAATRADGNGTGWTRRRRSIGAALGLVSLLVSLIGTGPVRASHSIASPPMFWDDDNTGYANGGDRFIYYKRTGIYWVQSSKDRFQEALSEWKDTTDFAPDNDPGGINELGIDGGTVCGTSCQPEVLAGNCLSFIPRVGYRDLIKSVININETHYSWSDASGPPAPGKVDLGGVLTHEIGHSITLIDLSGGGCNYGPGVYTMCGSASLPDTYLLRSLTSDDRAGANVVY